MGHRLPALVLCDRPGLSIGIRGLNGIALTINWNEGIHLLLALVLQDGHGGVATVDADYGAAGVGAGSAEIHALHRGAGGEALVPHVRREALALEDVSAGEADFLLDVGRAKDLGVDDGGVGEAVADVAAEAGQGFHRKSTDFVAALIP